MMAPVFCFGFQRSGTTLFSAMLDSHPDLAVPFSLTGLWFKMADRLDAYGDLQDRAGLSALIDDLLAPDSRLWLWNIPLDREAILDGLPLGDYPAVIARLHRLYAGYHGKAHWGHMDITSLTEMARLQDWFPDTRFVHLVRDARDVALSNQSIPYGAGNLLECAEGWARDVRANIAWGETLGPDRYHIVRYEDLVTVPEQTLTNLCNFLGLDDAPAMLDYAKTIPARVPAATRETLWPLLNKPLEASQAGRWRDGLSPAQAGVIERVAGPVLRNLGYDVPERPRSALAAGLLRLFYASGRGGRWPRLASRLGFKRRSS